MSPYEAAYRWRIHARQLPRESIMPRSRSTGHTVLLSTSLQSPNSPELGGGFGYVRRSSAAVISFRYHKQWRRLATRY